MKKCTLSRAVFSKVILASSIALAASTQAADISINGFISVVAGKTISEGKQRVDPTSAADLVLFTRPMAPQKALMTTIFRLSPIQCMAYSFARTWARDWRLPDR